MTRAVIFDCHCLFLLISELLAGSFGLNTDIISNKSNKSYGSGWCIDFLERVCVRVVYFKNRLDLFGCTLEYLYFFKIRKVHDLNELLLNNFREKKIIDFHLTTMLHCSIHLLSLPVLARCPSSLALFLWPDTINLNFSPLDAYFQ